MGSLLDPVLTLCVILVKSHHLSVTLSSENGDQTVHSCTVTVQGKCEVVPGLGNRLSIE
jgi:hypothetical protein